MGDLGRIGGRLHAGVPRWAFQNINTRIARDTYDRIGAFLFRALWKGVETNDEIGCETAVQLLAKCRHHPGVEDFGYGTRPARGHLREQHTENHSVLIPTDEVGFSNNSGEDCLELLIQNSASAICLTRIEKHQYELATYPACTAVFESEDS